MAEVNANQIRALYIELTGGFDEGAADTGPVRIEAHSPGLIEVTGTTDDGITETIWIDSEGHVIVDGDEELLAKPKPHPADFDKRLPDLRTSRVVDFGDGSAQIEGVDVDGNRVWILAHDFSEARRERFTR